MKARNVTERVHVTPSLPANLSGYKGDTKLLAASASGPVLEKRRNKMAAAPSQLLLLLQAFFRMA